MEIAILPKNSLRIKSKQAALVVDQQDKSDYAASLVLGQSLESLHLSDTEIIISAPGEYEVGGIKISGMRSETAMIYTMNVDGVAIVIGQLAALNKMQNKIPDNNMIVALCDTEDSASSLTSLTSNVVVLYGEKAEAIAQTFGEDKVKRMAKYSSTREKLPTEVETILLA